MLHALKRGIHRVPWLHRALWRLYVAGGFPARAQRRLQAAIRRGLQGKSDVVVVQVGANDGVQGDPLHALIVANTQWRALFIEPVDFLFDRLIGNYGRDARFRFRRCAISSFAGKQNFYHVSDDARRVLGERLPFWFDQLGSFDRAHIVAQLGGVLEPFIVATQVDVLPLTQVLEEHGIEEVDLLHVDAEGHDHEVLMSLDLTRYKPLVVLFEHAHLDADSARSVESRLLCNGYQLARHGDDTLAVQGAPRPDCVNK